MQLLMPSPSDANKWTDGKALLATGSPFPPVDTPGTDKKYIVAECNNVSGMSRFSSVSVPASDVKFGQTTDD